MRLTVLVHGQVQGVGYRRFVQTHARALGLSGHAENLENGRVEIVAEGPETELRRLLHWIKRGPPHAKVGPVDEQWSDSTGLQEFHMY